MSDKIKYLHSGMQGAPVVSNGFGDLVTMLDACLVTGFNLITVNGITRTGSVATATISSGHAFAAGQLILLAGATQTEYNGEFVITSVTANTLDFAVTGTPATPATTGTTFTAKAAPLGFAIAFTGTNKRVYRSPNTLGSRPFIRVDGSQLAGYDATWAKFCRVTIAENMTGIDTFVGAKAPFDPMQTTKNESKTIVNGADYYGWHKWYSANVAGNPELGGDGGTGAHQWQIIGDDRGFYLFINPCLNNSTGYETYAAGEFTSYKTGDAYNSILMADDGYRSANENVPTNGQGNAASNLNSNGSDCIGKALLRDYTQLGNPVRANFKTLGLGNGPFTSGQNTLLPFPNGPDYSLIIHPIYIQQENGNLRGVLPGQFAVLNGGAPYSNGVVIDNIAAYPNRKFVIISASSQGTANYSRIAFDLTGPWR